ncbi:AMP-binding protein [Roseovarius sp. M141]|uniref:AMP-binding protein n=1 Tax=Roseovarius sp. M141 TaxID=2583806 RepID=UPI0020CC1B11|nr:AMP-binding protein [Roseovarius sp. M141]
MSALRQMIARPADRDPIWRFPAEDIDLPLPDILSRARRMAGGMAQNGITAKDRVITLLDTGSDAVITLLAIWHLGAVAVPLRPQRAAECGRNLVSDVIAICAAKAVIHGTAPAGPDRPDGARDLHIAQLMAASAPYPPAAECGAADLALIQFTSGSTGQPRGVRVRYAMITAQLEQLCENYRVGDPAISPGSVGSWLPIYHDMGLFIGMLMPLYCGADALLAPPEYYVRNPARWFRALSDRRCDLTFSTSSILAATLRAARRLSAEDCDLSRLVLYVAAEKISPLVMDDLMRRLGPLGLGPANLRTGYGMAEYALGCTSSGSGPVARQHVRIDGDRVIPGPTCPDSSEIVSIGKPNTGCTLAIRDPAGVGLPDWRLGEITLVGPCLTDGYQNDPAATRRALGCGYLKTGDLGFTAAGEVYFVGRQDDTMTVAGRHIVPGDVELEIEALPFVGPGRSRLFGTDAMDTQTPRQILLIESPTPWTTAQATERIATIRRLTLGRFGFVPSDIVPVRRGTIEKTSSGKKRNRVIKQRWLAGEIPRLATEGA